MWQILAIIIIVLLIIGQITTGDVLAVFNTIINSIVTVVLSIINLIT